MNKQAQLNEALFNAIASGNLEKVKTLLRHGVDIHARLLQDKDWTALHFAVKAQKPEIVDYFLEQGADVNAVLEDNTPLMGAIYKENERIVEQLLKKEQTSISKERKARCIVHYMKRLPEDFMAS